MIRVPIGDSAVIGRAHANAPPARQDHQLNASASLISNAEGGGAVHSMTRLLCSSTVSGMTLVWDGETESKHSPVPSYLAD